MRARWLGVAGIALFGIVAGACGNGDDEVAPTPVVETEPIDGAVEIARLSLPDGLSDSEVADLIEDLCGGGDAGALVAQLQAVPITDQAQLAAAIDALAAGAEGYCPDDVDPAVDALQAAAAPTTTAPAASADAQAGAQSAGSGSSGTQRSGTSGSSGTSASPSNSSSGSASTGSGNASGTGNSSGTDFTQSVGSGSTSNSSSSGSGASSSTAG
jgi:hypothetical protein